MNKKIFIITILLFLPIFLNIVYAADYSFDNPPPDAKGWVIWLFGFPEEWITEPRGFIFYFIVPFIAIWAICLGFMKQIRIFSRASGVQYVISFAMAFSTLPTHIFVWLVSFLLGMAGMWATILFFGMFIVGATLSAGIFIRKQKSISGVYKAYGDKLKNYQRELDEVREKIRDEIEKPTPNAEELRKLRARETLIIGKLKEIKSAFEEA